MTHQLNITVVDLPKVQADLEFLAGAAERSKQLRERLVQLGELAIPQFRAVGLDRGFALGASELRIGLELSDGLADLVAAARAGDFDAPAV